MSLNMSTAKLCSVCSRDVSHMHRIRDETGVYYCQACYDRLAVGETPEEVLSDRCPSCGYAVGDDPQGVDGQTLCGECGRKQEAAVQVAGKQAAVAEPQAIPDRPLALHGLRSVTTCPHCWHRFPPDATVWVSQHADLLGDPIVGSDAPARFLPTRFTPEGDAIDARGMRSHQCGCPRCHLVIPRPLFETEALFTSIIGGPSSGKSYFLAVMTWQLRQQLPSLFGLGFSDIDATANHHLTQNEERLFLQSDRDTLVNLEKTQTEGDLYQTITLGQQPLSLPRPFMFSMQPLPSHSRHRGDGSSGRVLCMYDNAGEHYLAGRDTVSSPATQHLAMARVLMFLYDPTQDVRFRAHCNGSTSDPQMDRAARSLRQETILIEAANRARRFSGISERRKLSQPLLVIVSKLDAWKAVFEEDLEREPLLSVADNGGWPAVDLDRIDAVSANLRQLLLRLSPEFVAAAEGTSETVVYIPVSALGNPPERYSDREDALGIRPRDIRPAWVTVPFLYMFARWSSGLIAGARRRAASSHDNGNGRVHA